MESIIYIVNIENFTYDTASLWDNNWTFHNRLVHSQPLNDPHSGFQCCILLSGSSDCWWWWCYRNFHHKYTHSNRFDQKTFFALLHIPYSPNNILYETAPLFYFDLKTRNFQLFFEKVATKIVFNYCIHIFRNIGRIDFGKCILALVRWKLRDIRYLHNETSYHFQHIIMI